MSSSHHQGQQFHQKGQRDRRQILGFVHQHGVVALGVGVLADQFQGT